MNFKNICIIITLSILFLQCKAQIKSKSVLHFNSFDDTKISYTDEGNGKPVLLIHGFLMSGHNWNKTSLKKLLLDKGYRVIVPDLRGNGNSDKPHSQDAYANDAEIKDLIQLIDHLKIENCMAVGYSRGSIILAKLLTRENKISKAVFGGMGLDFTDPQWDRRIAFADVFSGRTQPNAMTKGAIDYATSINADMKVLGLLQDYQPVTSIEELNNINIETLVICGDKDLDNGNPKDLQQQMPNSKLIIVKGDHNNTYKQLDFAEEVIGFLQ